MAQDSLDRFFSALYAAMSAVDHAVLVAPKELLPSDVLVGVESVLVDMRGKLNHLHDSLIPPNDRRG